MFYSYLYDANRAEKGACLLTIYCISMSCITVDDLSSGLAKIFYEMYDCPDCIVIAARPIMHSYAAIIHTASEAATHSQTKPHAVAQNIQVFCMKMKNQCISPRVIYINHIKRWKIWEQVPKYGDLQAEFVLKFPFRCVGKYLTAQSTFEQMIIRDMNIRGELLIGSFKIWNRIWSITSAFLIYPVSAAYRHTFLHWVRNDHFNNPCKSQQLIILVPAPISLWLIV